VTYNRLPAGCYLTAHAGISFSKNMAELRLRFFFKKMFEGVTASQAVAEFCGDKMTLANQRVSTGQGNV